MDNIPADLRRQIDCCRSLKFQSDENLIINYYGDNGNLMRYKLESASAPSNKTASLSLIMKEPLLCLPYSKVSGQPISNYVINTSLKWTTFQQTARD